MTTKLSLQATLRDNKGRAEIRRLRKYLDMVPGNVYGAGKANTDIMMEHKQLVALLQTEGAGSQILALSVEGGETEQVILKSLQRHPSEHKIMHVDLQRVKAKEALHIKVPLHCVGEADCLGVKDGGVLQHLLKEIEVQCLPANLPAHLEVDVSGLAMDQSIHLSALRLPKGVKLSALEADPPHDDAVVSVHHAKAAPALEADSAAEAPAEGDDASVDEAHADSDGGTPSDN